VGERGFRLVEHIIRMVLERPAHCGIDWTPADGKETSHGRLGGQHFLKIGRQEESAGGNE